MGLHADFNTFRNFRLGLFTRASQIALGLNVGLKWYYTMDEASGTRFDSGINFLDLTEGGVVAGVPGIIGNAWQSPGPAMNNLQRGFNAVDDLSSTDFTITGWFNLLSNFATRTLMYLGIGDFTAAEQVIELFYDNPSDSMRFMMSDGVSQASLNIDIGGTIPTTQFIFYAFRWDSATQTMEARLDGQAYTPTSFGLSPHNPGTQSLVFANLVTPDFSFVGNGDEAGCWDRKLSNTETDFLYNGGLGQRPDFIACLFDETLTNILTDELGNNLIST